MAGGSGISIQRSAAKEDVAKTSATPAINFGTNDIEKPRG
jgi:hypothetical protein